MDRPPATARPLLVFSELTLRRELQASVVVERGGLLWLRGEVVGDLHVGKGGRAHVLGRLVGDATVEGRLVVRGTVRGEVHALDGSSLVVHDGASVSKVVRRRHTPSFPVDEPAA